MPLSNPVKHRLVEGSVGEVIPAELLQRTAAFGDSAVETLHVGHHRDWRGYMQHRGLEYAVAGACFLMPPAFATVLGVSSRRDVLDVDLSNAYCLWSFGWEDGDPKLVKDPPANHPNVEDRAFVNYYVECKVQGPGPIYLHATCEYDSTAMGIHDGGIVFPHGDGFRVYAGNVTIDDPEKEPTYTVGAVLRELRRVILWATK